MVVIIKCLIILNRVKVCYSQLKLVQIPSRFLIVGSEKEKKNSLSFLIVAVPPV